MLPNCELVNVFGTQYLVFKGKDLISNALKQGGYEIEVFAIAQKILQKHKDGVVLDIGANLGSFTLPLAKTNSHLTFHAFEPQRIVYYQLCGNTLINGLDNVYNHELALSVLSDSVTVQLPDYSLETNIGAFSIDEEVRENEYECQTADKFVSIQTEPLDDLNYINVRLLKIDVEGHELEVLEGGIETIKRNNYPPIIFEAWTWKPWYQEKRTLLFDYLKDLGYEITEGINSNNLAQHPKHGEMLK
jgi:FkbM family methyltransferase